MKYEIFQSENNKKYYFRLKAKNGQIILSSQGYASKDSAKKGVESVRTNSPEDGQYERKESSNGKQFFNLLAKNKQVIGSSQQYASKEGMENGIKSVMTNGPEAVVEDLTVAK